MTLTDAGPLVALIDIKQAQNARCRTIFAKASLPLITTWSAFAEAMYLLSRIGGWQLQKMLWKFAEDGVLVFHAHALSEPSRMQALMEQYRDRPMDFADASLVSAAEVRDDKRIFTIDSDFYIYQWNSQEPFDVLF